MILFMLLLSSVYVSLIQFVSHSLQTWLLNFKDFYDLWELKVKIQWDFAWRIWICEVMGLWDEVLAVFWVCCRLKFFYDFDEMQKYFWERFLRKKSIFPQIIYQNLLNNTSKNHCRIKFSYHVETFIPNWIISISIIQ